MDYETIRKANEAIGSVDVQGRDYVMVNQRVKAFRMVYPDGFIRTSIINWENGIVVFKASCGYHTEDGRELIVGEGTAYEKENSSNVNRTSYIENCVPLDTQILTDQGWKYYYQLKEGDNVLSLNMETRKVEYCRLKAINRYPSKALKKLKTSRFEVVCTDQHKWVVDGQYADIGKVATVDLRASHRIIQNIPQEVSPSGIGKKLGWLMCDCEIKRTSNGMPSTADINQSKHIEEITALFGEGRKTIKYNEKWKDNYEWSVDAEEVRSILGHFGISSYKDLPLAIAQASIEDVKGAYESMMLADGSDRGFSSTYIELVEAMQIMCARLGIATSFITERMCKKSTRPIYTLGIKRTHKTCVSELKVTNLPPQDVWCPTTENGTWFLRQGTFVTLTSNCETSAVGRALGMAGFGIDASMASAEEVQNALLNQKKQSAPARQTKQTTPPQPPVQPAPQPAVQMPPFEIPDSKDQLALMLEGLGADLRKVFVAYKKSSLEEMTVEDLKQAYIRKYNAMNKSTKEVQ